MISSIVMKECLDNNLFLLLTQDVIRDITRVYQK